MVFIMLSFPPRAIVTIPFRSHYHAINCHGLATIRCLSGKEITKLNSDKSTIRIRSSHQSFV